MSHGFCGPHFVLMAGVDKTTLRADGLARRAAVPAAAAIAFAARLARVGPGLALAHKADSVSAFWSIGDEVGTEPLVRALDAAGFPVGLPITGKIGVPLVFRRWTPDAEMIPGQRGILEPPTGADVVDPDVVFVPVATFDRRGHRIGYGAGFYDLTLAALRAKKSVVAIGVAYAVQETLFIPHDAHDQPLDFIVTDKEMIVCAGLG